MWLISLGTASSGLMHVVACILLHPFSWPNNIPLSAHAMFCFSIHLSVHAGVPRCVCVPASSSFACDPGVESVSRGSFVSDGEDLPFSTAPHRFTRPRQCTGVPFSTSSPHCRTVCVFPPERVSTWTSCVSRAQQWVAWRAGGFRPFPVPACYGCGRV